MIKIGLVSILVLMLHLFHSPAAFSQKNLEPPPLADFLAASKKSGITLAVQPNDSTSQSWLVGDFNADRREDLILLGSSQPNPHSTDRVSWFFIHTKSDSGWKKVTEFKVGTRNVGVTWDSSHKELVITRFNSDAPPYIIRWDSAKKIYELTEDDADDPE